MIALRSRGLKRGAVALALLVAVAWAISQRKNSSFTLPDASVLSVDSAQFGRSNVFMDGTTLEKLLGPVLPANGIDILGFSIRKPAERTVSSRDGETLVMRLCLSNPNETKNIFF